MIYTSPLSCLPESQGETSGILIANAMSPGLSLAQVTQIVSERNFLQLHQGNLKH